MEKEGPEAQVAHTVTCHQGGLGQPEQSCLGDSQGESFLQKMCGQHPTGHRGRHVLASLPVPQPSGLQNVISLVDMIVSSGLWKLTLNSHCAKPFFQPQRSLRPRSSSVGGQEKDGHCLLAFSPCGPGISKRQRGHQKVWARSEAYTPSW